MPLGCALVDSLVCFHRHVKRVHEDWGLGRSDTVTGRGLKARIFEGDNFIDADLRVQTEVCAAGTCVRYHRHCVESAAEYSCSYAWSRLGDVSQHTLEVSAPLRERYQIAVRSIALLTEEPIGAGQMPLDELRAESDSASVPSCPRNHVREDCRA